MDILSFIQGFAAGKLQISDSGGSGDSGDSGGSGGSGGDSGGNDATSIKMRSGYFSIKTTTTLLFPQEYSDFIKHPAYTDYVYREVSPAEFQLTAGGKYSILFDGLQRHYTAQAFAAKGSYIPAGIAIGNLDLLDGEGVDPFLLIYCEKDGKSFIFTRYTSPIHTIFLAKNEAPTQKTIAHGLGEMPDFVLVYYASGDLTGGATGIAGKICSVWGLKSTFAAYSSILSAISGNGMSRRLETEGLDNMSLSNKQNGYIFCDDEETFTLGDLSEVWPGKLASEQTYNWIAMSNLGGGSNLMNIDITENGRYVADEGYGGFGVVNVNVIDYEALAQADYYSSMAKVAFNRTVTGSFGNSNILRFPAVKFADGDQMIAAQRYAFAGFPALKKAKFAKMGSVYEYAFEGDPLLETLDFTTVDLVGNVVFGVWPYGLSGLDSLQHIIVRPPKGSRLTSVNFARQKVIDENNIVTGYANATDGCTADFKVYVPAEDYETIYEIMATNYSAGTNCVDPSAKLLSLGDYPEIDHWDDTYTVTFYDGETEIGTKTCGYNGSVSMSYSKEGQTLLGWATADGGAANANNLKGITADRRLYAVWMPAGTLDSMSWSDISTYSRAGTAADYFSVGDSKSISWSDDKGNLYGALVAVAGFGLHRNTSGTKDGVTWIMGNWIAEDCTFYTSPDSKMLTKLPSDLQAVLQSSMISTQQLSGSTAAESTATMKLFHPELANIVAYSSILNTSGGTGLTAYGQSLKVASNTADATLFPLFSGKTLAEIAEFFNLKTANQHFITRTLAYKKTSTLTLELGVTIVKNDTYTLCKRATANSGYYTFCFRT